MNKRWNQTHMLDLGHRLFTKVHKRKHSAQHNHEIHFLAREINDWLPQGIQSIIDGSYWPRHLRRYYFSDEMVDQLHITDRVMQHILLQQLKPTFKHVMNPNCLHLNGPTGVKLATQRVRQALQDEQPQFFIRADIKSFYRSILHHKLLQDIKQHYDDPKLITMLERIIRNPLETPRGYKNPDNGVALRGPLSQFFSAIYLKPLDDAFDSFNVTYIRYQDDILILCQTKRQLNRCRRRMMEVLQERRLTLSRKKSRIGSVQDDFHFLGIQYKGTRTLSNTTVSHSANDSVIAPTKSEAILAIRGGSSLNDHQQNALSRMVPHARTLRKARTQVQLMVADQFSTAKIKNYLRRWTQWWVKTVESWSYHELLQRFLNVCWDATAATYAVALSQRAREVYSCSHAVSGCAAAAA